MTDVENQPTFRILFNKNRQYISVFLWDVHPTTFSNWGGGNWGYFQGTWQNTRNGEFGEVHFVKSRIREDLVVHEMFHVLCEWLFCRGVDLSAKNEERMAEFLDELVRKFYREYRKV